MFSATMPKNIMRMAEEIFTQSERVAVGSTSDPAKNITQALVRVGKMQIQRSCRNNSA